jgi:hypothetical protein
MWKPRRLTTLWASTACYRNTLLIFYATWRHALATHFQKFFFFCDDTETTVLLLPRSYTESLWCLARCQLHSFLTWCQCNRSNSCAPSATDCAANWQQCVAALVYWMRPSLTTHEQNKTATPPPPPTRSGKKPGSEISKMHHVTKTQQTTSDTDN